ncbi:MAG TPA: TRAP transporter large permease subunit, partial [Sneathiellales bacterium]|nr:TRAP transporter large permease subunit [Sneathiellales bacterium]
MIDVTQAVIGFFMMLSLMALGLHVGVAMLITSIIGVLVFMGATPLESYGNQLWSYMNDFLLTSIPLFVLLGEILLRS